MMILFMNNKVMMYTKRSNVAARRKIQHKKSLFALALLVVTVQRRTLSYYSQYLGILVPSGAVVSKNSVGRSRLRFLRRLLFTGNR